MNVRYIEVKTTEADEGITDARFSAYQVQAMRDHKQNYSLYRVYNVNKKESEIHVKIIRNPFQELIDDHLNVSRISIRI